MRSLTLRHGVLVLAGTLSVGVFASSVSLPGAAAFVHAQGGKSAPDDLNDLSLQVDALLTLHYFEFTPTQLEAVAKTARLTVQRPQPRDAAQASDKFRTALTELRDALVKGKDNAQIDHLKDALDEVRRQDDADLDDDVEITDGARTQTAAVLRSLSVRQVAGYVDRHPYELPDPLELLLTALDKSGELKDAEWQEHREDAAAELSWLLGGLDKRKVKQYAVRVETWLNQARALSPRDRVQKRADLEKSARQLVEAVGPTTVLHHIVEHALAELLSNPQLPAALAARLGK